MTIRSNHITFEHIVNLKGSPQNLTMQKPFRDLTGLRFSRLTVIEKSKERGTDNQILWLCKCDCGKTKLVQSGSLNNSNTQSCGCLYKNSPLKGTHKNGHHALYSIWRNMRERCQNLKCDAFKDYGQRGIKVCDRWNDIRNFIADMPERPSLEYTLDRINNDGNYEPSNCRWATKKQQANNRRKISKLSEMQVLKDRISKLETLVEHLESINYSNSISGISS